MVKTAIPVTKARPLLGMFLFLMGLFMALSLWDYEPQFSSFYRISSQEWNCAQGNRLGTIGVGFAFYTCRYLGRCAWLLPVYFLWAALLLLTPYAYKVQRKNVICFILALLFTPATFAFFEAIKWLNPCYTFYSSGIGGSLGNYLFSHLFEGYLGPIGSALVLIPGTCLSLLFTFSNLNFLGQMVLHVWTLLKQIGNYGAKLSKRLISSFKGSYPQISPTNTGTKYLRSIKEKFCKWTQWLRNRLERKSSQISKPATPSSEENWQPPYEEKVIRKNPVKPAQNKQDKATASSNLDEDKPKEIQILASETIEKATQKRPEQTGDYLLPSLQLLKDPPPTFNDGSAEDYYETAEDLVQKLAEFGVEVKVEAIQSGPVITRYEVTPARGVRVEKIETLDKNIALGLKALSVRIQAPVPGKGCVGIEVPNKKPLPVCLKEILESKAWAQSGAEIPIVLGKEVTGRPIVADLTKMPHLLIAGSTGSGKTVCINAIIASLLYHSSPKDLRFIMVDPKIVEMKLYNDLPHMLIPVVTDPKRVPSALKWLIGEMERRYQLFANYGVRNIAGFNEKLKKMTPNELLAESLEHLPYIVCIIDELADLMMVAPGDIETCIARLAQLARAAGIHLIIATQRPSVNVITGIIKANLPSRIAFKVASKVDSRTILDMGGADSLIGKGDMLFIPPGASQLIRAQGAWVSDDEINAIVDFLKCNGAPQFAEDVQRIVDTDFDESSNNEALEGEDALLSQALDVLKTSERISTSLLQRRLKIGYNRAARIMETLDSKGLLPKNME